MLDAGDIVQGSVDGINWTTASVSGNTITWANVTLTAGDNILQLKVVDKAGNSGSILKQSYTLDQVAPESSQPALDRGIPDITGTPITGDNITNDTTPSFIGFGEEDATVTVFADENNNNLLDDGEELGTAKVANGIWTITASQLGAGEYAVKAIQTDIAGNVSEASTALPVTIDLTPPDITFSGLKFLFDSGIPLDFITNVGKQIITTLLSSELSEGDIVYGSVNNGATWTAITDKVIGTLLT